MNMTFTRAKTILCAALLLAWISTNAPDLWAQQVQVPNVERDIRWGKTDESGLRLGIFQVEGKPVVFCELENTGEKSVAFNDYFLDYSEAITIQARPKGTEDWVKIRLKPGQQLYKSAGPSQNNNVTLAPGQLYRLPEEVFVASKTPYTILDLALSNFIWREREKHSFLVEINRYVWPEKWSGTIELWIRQELPNFGLPNQWEGELESGILEMDATRFVHRDAYAKPFDTAPNRPKDTIFMWLPIKRDTQTDSRYKVSSKFLP